ncbi:MAG: DUF2723 domain-containing protein [Anaerolineae bacterium]|nr:DUF2723 domain-containing protein [Anaerolineae bacterium]
MPKAAKSRSQRLSFRRLAARPARVAAVLVLPLSLLLVYATTLQTQINGSSNEYMIDVGEIQVALNVWGTIHHTGYPLFAILGNLFTLPFRTLGIEPAAAASLYATAWGVVALGGTGLLVWRLTGRVMPGILSAVVLGLARSIWIHNVIAEVYSMGLAITVLMLVVVLWPVPWTGAWRVERRIMWLALLGGIGVSHHRAVAFIAPGLLLALWPHLKNDRINWRHLIPLSIGLALVGFLPYIYLPLRDWQGGEWVYGEPGTLRGLWIEFSGKEADRLVTLPADAAGWLDNIKNVWAILAGEITLPGLLFGLVGLGLAVTVSPYRRAARVVALSAAGPTLFTIAYHTAVLPEAILMPTVLALVFSTALLVDWLSGVKQPLGVTALIGLVIWPLALIGLHHGWIHDLVTDPTGQETIARIKQVPRDGQPAFMLPWGPRYSAAAYSSLVTGENDDVLMVDHKGNYSRLLADGYQLYTEPETFYTYPPPWPTPFNPQPSEWWHEHLGQLYLTSAAPGIIRLQNSPWLAEADDPPGVPIVYGIARRDAWLTCDDTSIYLHVIWQVDSRPTGDPSIFVHLTGDEPAPNPPNADSRHPVYGLYPFTQWSPGELARDDFTLPRLPDGTQVRFGLYEQDASGQFVNYGETILPVTECQIDPETSYE